MYEVSSRVFHKQYVLSSFSAFSSIVLAFKTQPKISFCELLLLEKCANADLSLM